MDINVNCGHFPGDRGLCINTDCRHFPGDRPCAFHKQTGVVCESCAHFEDAGVRILIVKLDALGDVLRTTCVLPSLKSRHPDGHITWITSKAALPVLENNPYIDEVFALSVEGLARLGAESFDLVLNPDASKTSAALASLAKGKEKRGFVLGEDGQVRPCNPAAARWLELGARDDLKRKNRMTYQDHLHHICSLKPDAQEIILRLGDGERERARRLALFAGIRPGERLIGFNTGSSSRWPRKRWPRERFLDLAAGLQKTAGRRVLLLGGPLEQETNRWIAQMSGGYAIDSGTEHGVREYFALLDLCDVIVTGDTLGMHAALALNRKVVALFGPTSPWEIDMYGRGERIVSDVDCICCYRRDCERSPTCMDRIEVARVEQAVLRLLESSSPTDGVAAEELAVPVV